MLPTRVPEYQRRALRLALGVGIPCLIGFGVVGPEHVRWSEWAQTMCKWAAITAAIVTSPMIGKATQVGFERIVGTVLGGVCGFIVHTFGASVLFDEHTDGIWLAFAAALLSGAAVIGGYRLGLDTSAKLFTITLLLVTFAGDAGEATWSVALVRVGGIVTGVFFALVLSVFVLPKSASIECLHCIDRALASLHKLYALVWREYLPDSSRDAWEEPKKASEGVSFGETMQYHPWYPATSATPLLPGRGGGGMEGSHLVSIVDDVQEGQDREEEVNELCEEALTGVYSSLLELQSVVVCAKSERLAGRFAGRLIFVPRFIAKEADHLPWAELEHASMSIRRSARTLFAIGQALEATDSTTRRSTLGDADNLLKGIAHSGYDVIVQAREAFPSNREKMSSEPVLQLLEAVEHFEMSGGEAFRAQLRGSKKYQAAVAAVANLTIEGQRQVSSETASGGCNVPENEGFGVPLQSSESRELASGAVEWYSLGFQLRQVGLELAQMQQRLLSTMDRLP